MGYLQIELMNGATGHAKDVDVNGAVVIDTTNRLLSTPQQPLNLLCLSQYLAWRERGFHTNNRIKK